MYQTNEVISVQDAVEVAVQAAKEIGLETKEEQLLELLPMSCDILQIEGGRVILLKDLEGFIKNVSQAIKFRDSSFLKQKRGLNVDRVVGVQEFVESSEYMNQRGSCRPVVMDGLIELFESPRSEGYIECVLSGSQGWGKTFFSCLAIGYMIYKLSCLYNPQAEYGLAPGTSIVFIQQSKKYDLARKVVFDQFAEMLMLSPYFSDVFPFDRHVKSELRFLNNIHVIPVGGSDTSAIGMNVFGGVIDEMNFMAKIKRSERFAAVGLEDMTYDQAEKVYSAIIRRMKNRFIQRGKLPGKLLLVSSVNYEGDFTDRKKSEAAKETKEGKTQTILYIYHNLWEALPSDRFSGERFLVEPGSELYPPKILNSIDEAVDQSNVLSVPVELKSDFDRDLIAALRDYGGLVSTSQRPFIPYKDLIAEAKNDYIKIAKNMTLFKYQEVVIDKIVDPDVKDWSVLVDLDYIHKCIVDPSSVFSLHIDVATSEDALGLAVGRLYGYKMLPSTKYFNPKLKEFVEVRDIRAPIYMIDGVLRIVPPPWRRQIDLGMVRDLVLWLRGYLYIKWATMDSYQSTMMIQAFRKANMRSGVLSVDTSIAPYTELKLSIKDGRILYPPHLILEKELKEVEKDPEKDKIIHPEDGSKDVSDAVAGVVYMLQMKEANYGRVTSSARAARGDIRQPEPEGIKNDEVRTIKVKRRIGEGNLSFIKRTRVI